MADSRIPDDSTSAPSDASSGIGQPPQGANVSGGQDADSPQLPPLNLGVVMNDVMDACMQLATILSSETPAVLLDILQEQSQLISELASLEVTPGICQASLSALQTMSQQVESLESQTESAMQESETSAQQFYSMLASAIQTYTQVLQIAGKGINT